MASFEDAQAMSHKEKCGQILVRVLPFLTLHEGHWYRDRHYHKTHRGLATCPCCRTNKKSQFGCRLCADAWSLSQVNVIFKLKVYAYGVTFRTWWWVWTPEYRKQKREEKKSKGKGKRKDKGKGKGYEPHAYHQARAPQLSITDIDPWVSWDTPGQEWVTQSPSTPPLPPREEAFIAELEDIAQRPPSPSPSSMWTHDPPPPPPPLDLDDQPEIRSCRKDGSFDRLLSRLGALAVPDEIPTYVAAEEEKSCHNVEDYEQTTSTHLCRLIANETGDDVRHPPREEHAFEESVPKEEHDPEEEKNADAVVLAFWEEEEKNADAVVLAYWEAVD